jgi:hypothetical protein
MPSFSLSTWGADPPDVAHLPARHQYEGFRPPHLYIYHFCHGELHRLPLESHRHGRHPDGSCQLGRKRRYSELTWHDSD